MDSLILDPEVLVLGQRYYRELLGRHRLRMEDTSKISHSKGNNLTSKLYRGRQRENNILQYFSSRINSLSRLVDVDEEIERVTVYKLPLGWQFSTFILYHNFVLFETYGWWLTIEKNDEGITIQRSKHLTSVKDFYRQKKREYALTEDMTDSGRKSVGN